MKADHFSPDIQEFLALLAEHGVRYLIVGGEAVIYYGYARLTGDVDILFEQTPDNAAALFIALLAFWEGEVPEVEGPGDLLEPGLILQFGRPPNRLDLLGSITAVDFAQAWTNRQDVALEAGAQTVAVHYIGLSDLIRNKRAVGRDKDRDDLDYLTDVSDDDSPP